MTEAAAEISAERPTEAEGADIPSGVRQVFRHAVALAMVVAATAAAIGFQAAVAATNLTLIFVLPVIGAAAAFGWGPALTAVVAGVLAYDFFFTVPYYSFAIASPSDIWAAILLLVVAVVVSAIAAESRRAVQRARASATRARALQGLAHLVIGQKPQPALAQAAAGALSAIFGGPAVVLTQQGENLHPLAASGGAKLEAADLDAAKGALETGVRARAGAYPFVEASYDFWRVSTPSGGPLLLGVKLGDGRDRLEDPETYVEMVGGYLAAGQSRLAAQV